MTSHVYVVNDRRDGITTSATSNPGVGAVLTMDDAGPLATSITAWIASDEIDLVS